jgi:integrase
VVVDELRRPWRPELYSDTFGRLAASAGVPVIRLHGCRHTALSVMVDRGVPISVVPARTDPADAAFTLRRYVHDPRGDRGRQVPRSAGWARCESSVRERA